jgi:hypothetical protein
MPHLLPTCFVVLLASSFFARGASQDIRTLDAAMHHYGDDATPEWPEAPANPEAAPLVVEFEARRNADECVFFMDQRHVNNACAIELNGKVIGELATGDELGERRYTIPAGALVDGANRLIITSSAPADDFTVGNIRLYEGSLRELLKLVAIHVRVKDGDTGAGLPARVTAVPAAAPNGAAAEIYYATADTQAARPTTVYTSEGNARFELPAGEYDIYATRGSEWSLGKVRIVAEVPLPTVELSLTRVVDTTGFIAADTHIHTLTNSGHGDSSLEERVITLAGEGVELAIATDHNHNTDYTPYQQALALDEYFTPVTGNEVTTPIGHFNAFPLNADDPVPPYDLHDPVQLVDGMRAKGAQVVILNHPRWPDHDTGPFGVAGLDRATGARTLPFKITFDAMELVNSTTAEVDPYFLFEDWFALLNRGERIVAVGSSDSHTVGDPVGQGRTYVKSSTDDPAKIDVDEACRNIREGRSSIGLGIFAHIEVDDAFSMGDTLTVKDNQIQVNLHVDAPDWIEPRTGRFYLNGVKVLEFPVDPPAKYSTKDFHMYTTLNVPPGQDAYLVCVIVGPEADQRYWPGPNRYTLAATNPVYLDNDGDGVYSSPRATAQQILDHAGPGPASVEAALARCDEAVALQLLSLVREVYLAEAHEQFLQVGGAAAAKNPRIKAWIDSQLPPQ